MLFKAGILRVISTSVGWFGASPWRLFPILLVLTFLPRFNELQHMSQLELIPTGNRELGAIAISLAQTGRFDDPYAIPTGPTAHLPPVYPLVVGLVYRWFGLTPTAGYVAHLLIAIAASVLYALLPWAAGQFGLPLAAGLIAGVAAARTNEEWPGHGEYLAGLALVFLLVAFLRRWTSPRATWQSSLLLGLGIGAAFHLQPALLPVILGCFAFEVWWGRSWRTCVSVALCSVGILVACLPWAWRNYTAFQAVFFIRSNLGLELRMGNHEGAAATIDVMDARPYTHYVHPTLLSREAAKVRDMGESAYMSQAGEEAWQWIRSHPREFIWLTVQRVANVWAGPLHRPSVAAGVLLLTILAAGGYWLRREELAVAQRAALIIPLATYPLIYYLVAYMPRYRIPIDWILFLLSGSLVWTLLSRLPVGRSTAGNSGRHPTA